MRFIYTTLFTLLLTSLYTTTSAQVCHPDDQAALERLRDLTNGGGGPGSWNTVTNIPNGSVARWVGSNVYEWHGIDTMPDPTLPGIYRVRTINLDGANFQGVQRLENELPDSIFVGFGLEYCDTLILNDNKLTGITGNLSDFSTNSLKYLNVSNNDFVPGNNNTFSYLMSNFDALEMAKFNNIMDGTSSALDNYIMPTLSSLKTLFLQNNKFTGILKLHTLANANFESMTELSVSLNDLGAIDLTLNAGLSSLQKLHVAYNDISNFQDISNCLEFLPALTHFDGPSCMDESLGAQILLTATSFPSILQIDLSSNGLIGELPVKFFEDIPTIEVIDVHNNNLGGTLPDPQFIFTAGPFAGIRAYEGTANLKTIHIHSNSFQGSLHLDWFLLGQLNAYLPSLGQNMPLLQFNASDNDFKEILPHLGQNHITAILNTLTNRFASLTSLSLQDNALDFKDLFRAKKIFRLKQITVGPNDHYVPQTSTINPNDFSYAPQDSVGIGGLKRRNAGDSVIIAVGRNVVEEEIGGPTHVLRNKYSWERVNNLGGFNTIGSVLPGGGFSGPGGPGYQPANGNLGDSLHQHTLGIKNLDGQFHHDQRFTACVDNDSFPNLTICLKQKKIEVGDCVDDFGHPIECQKVMVQFHQDTLAQMTPAEQDSFKLAQAAEIGATPVASCVCGDLELWEISDTASTMVEGFGKGTMNTATSISARPSLLSAESNHSISDTTGDATLPDTTAMPASNSGNNTSKTLVAIMDSGIDYDYTSLVPYISEGASQTSSCMQDAIWGYNFLDSTNNASDDHGHGTAIAGIVTGLSKQNLLPDTGSTIAILPLKYTNKGGEGTVFNAACGVYYAADYSRTLPSGETARVRVMNNSWGYYGQASEILENTIRYAANDCGILIVCSAGNDNSVIHGADSLNHWPSNSIWDPMDTIAADNILTVGAINSHNGNNLASYSNFSNVHVDIVAQGTDSTTHGGSSNGFEVVHGTSFATAQVSRAAALLFDKYPNTTYWAMKYALMQSVDKLQSSDSLNIKSGGRLNYERADSILGALSDRTICSDYNLVGIEQVETLENKFVLYPNPVSDNLTIERLDVDYNNPINISLYNVQGQMLDFKVMEAGDTQRQLSTKDLPAGVYFIRLYYGNKQISKKIIKH